jgi:hypothetical protein
MSARLAVVPSLHQLCRAPRLLVARLQRLYINYAMRREYSSPGRTGSTSTLLCAATNHHPSARALPQPCRASSHCSAPHWSVALALAVRPVIVSRLLIAQVHWLYCAYAVHPDAPSCRSTSRQSVTLALAVRPVTPFRGSSAPPLNLLSGRTGSTSATPCSTTTCLTTIPTLPKVRHAPP